MAHTLVLQCKASQRFPSMLKNTLRALARSVFDRKTNIHFQYLREGEFLSLKGRNQVRNGPFTVAAAAIRSIPLDAVEALADVHSLYLLSNYAL